MRIRYLKHALGDQCQASKRPGKSLVIAVSSAMHCFQNEPRHRRGQGGAMLYVMIWQETCAGWHIPLER
jgi:hypothetical protein